MPDDVGPSEALGGFEPHPSPGQLPGSGRARRGRRAGGHAWSPLPSARARYFAAFFFAVRFVVFFAGPFAFEIFGAPLLTVFVFDFAGFFAAAFLVFAMSNLRSAV